MWEESRGSRLGAICETRCHFVRVIRNIPAMLSGQVPRTNARPAQPTTNWVRATAPGFGKRYPQIATDFPDGFSKYLVLKAEMAIWKFRLEISHQISSEISREISSEISLQSPLFQYHAPTIEKALHNLSSGKALAGSVAGYPVTQKDVRNWVLTDILQPLLKTATQFATFFLGPAGIGKTPLANAMCTSLSTCWQGEHGVVDAVPKFKSGIRSTSLGQRQGR